MLVYVLMHWLSFVIPSLVFATLHTPSIPRAPRSYINNEAAFEGGSPVPANIENLRSSWHPDQGFERWVIDFSDTATKQIGKAAPTFQIRYTKSSGVPKLIVEFKAIRSNRLQMEDIRKLLVKSHFVKDVILYPPIEEGEVAVEFLLKKPLSFSAHQPLENEGRLVFDLKAAP